MLLAISAFATTGAFAACSCQPAIEVPPVAKHDCVTGFAAPIFEAPPCGCNGIMRNSRNMQSMPTFTTITPGGINYLYDVPLGAWAKPSCGCRR